MDNGRIQPPNPVWEGSVGATFSVRKNSRTDDYFLTFELVRRTKNEATGAWIYPHDFSERNVEALANVISRALRVLSETDANAWARRQRNGDSSVSA